MKSFPKDGISLDLGETKSQTNTQRIERKSEVKSQVSEKENFIMKNLSIRRREDIPRKCFSNEH